MQVVSSLVTYHKSWNEASKTQEEGNGDGDKLLCNTFNIRVISKHQKIDTLFDSGWEVNLISKAIVKKLGLLTTPHKKPYPLGWVCDKAVLQVTR